MVRLGAAAGVCLVLAITGPQMRGQDGRFVRSQLTWFDRSGRKLGVLGRMADYGNLELSPDGRRIAVGVLTDPRRGTRDIWIVDAVTGAHTAFTSDPADENWAVWSPDGSALIFNSGRDGGLDLYRAPARAVDPRAGEPLLVDSDAKWPVSWSSDGRWLLYVIGGRQGGNHIRVLPLEGGRPPIPYRQEQESDSENWAALSPDGKWVAYSSTESGQPEVYVAPFPATGAGSKQLVSHGGGVQARWRRDGRELYYVSSDRHLMAVDVGAGSGGAALAIGEPHALFELRFPYWHYHAFDAAADGQRFLVNVLVTLPGTVSAAH